MSKHSNRILEKYKETKKKELLVYLILRALILLCMVLQILRGDLNNAFLCGFSLLLFTIPTFIEDKFKIEFPTVLESTVYVFIFAAEILGEINNFYGIIPFWDSILHSLNGFLCAGIGFSLVDLLNENSKALDMSPIFVSIVAFCVSMTIGVCWEFFEYGMDKHLNLDMQKDVIISDVYTVKLNEEGKNKTVPIKEIKETRIITEDNVYVIDNGYLDIGLKDTMEDLFVNLIGAIWFSVVGYMYIQNREKYKFAENFITVKNDKQNINEGTKKGLK